MYKKKP